MGDEHYDKAASDIIFEIRELKHKRFERQDNLNLYIT
jgi:DnaJ-class molecular chaperone